MKWFKSSLFAIVLILFSLLSGAQTFFDGPFDQSKHYVLLAHPTVGNLETIQFLLKHNLLKLPENTEFVGVYAENEVYDYSRSSKFLTESGSADFHLQSVKGELSNTEVFRENVFTNQFKKLFSHSGGLILFGGPDIQPEIYGEKNTASVVTDPNRHLFEVSFVFHLLGGTQNPAIIPLLKSKPNYMITGFCLGMQTLNVATGGTMIQDIPSEIYDKTEAAEIVKLSKNELHRNSWPEISNDTLLMGCSFHAVKCASSDFFRNKIHYTKPEIANILSFHHQAVENLNSCWIVTATSMDAKITEGIWHRNYPNVFAVQFHPEVSALYENREKLKFSPDDHSETYHHRIAGSSMKFHQKYWNAISEAIQSSVK